jgi:tRNA pseudouridine55 synthase
MADPIPLESLPVLYSDTEKVPTEDEFKAGLIIPVNKPLDWSSFQVVKFIRNRIPVKKVGHAGTLDPKATGLLVLCCGKATKSISMIQEQQKDYIADIRFGASTPSYDSATEADETAPFEHITEDQITNILNSEFMGTVMQVPPMFSALKRDGKRLYKLARKGEMVELQPRPVQIYEIEVLSFKNPDLKLKVTCGKGTYIRSIAHDLGKKVGSLAYLSALERTEIGSFTVESAWQPEQFEDWLKQNG